MKVYAIRFLISDSAQLFRELKSRKLGDSILSPKLHGGGGGLAKTRAKVPLLLCTLYKSHSFMSFSLSEKTEVSAKFKVPPYYDRGGQAQGEAESEKGRRKCSHQARL